MTTPTTKTDDGLCRVCGVPHEGRSWQARDGRCLSCKRDQQNASNRANPDRLRQKAKQNYARNRDWYLSYQRNKTKTDPEFAARRAARRKVYTEIEAGRMAKRPCAECGCPKSEAHHEDYSRPLDVVWLCRSHHVAADAMLAARKAGAQ